MADLLKRLMDEPTEHELKDGLDSSTTRIWNDLCKEAATEITRLRAAVEAEKEQAYKRGWEDCWYSDGADDSATPHPPVDTERRDACYAAIDERKEDEATPEPADD